MLKRPDAVIGIISDTHLPYRMEKLPTSIYHIFQGVDCILHAGDVDEIAHLHPLQALAPLHAVRGNIHLGDFSMGGRDLPAAVQVMVAGKQIVVTHGHRPGLMGWLLKVPEILWATLPGFNIKHLNYSIAQRLCNAFPQADIVVFGHTHAAYAQKIGKILVFNPGSVVPNQGGMQSVGLIHIWQHKVVTYVVPIHQQLQRQARLTHWLNSPSPAVHSQFSLASPAFGLKVEG